MGFITLSATLQVVLDALNELGKAPDFMSGLVAMGMEVGKMVPVEMENPGVGDVLMAWNGIYQSLHRNADMGQLLCEKGD